MRRFAAHLHTKQCFRSITMKRLYKSSLDRKISGVCGGIGEYFDIDPTLVRVIWVLAALCGTLGFWAYLLCALIIPNDVEIK